MQESPLFNFQLCSCVMSTTEILEWRWSTKKWVIAIWYSHMKVGVHHMNHIQAHTIWQHHTATDTKTQIKTKRKVIKYDGQLVNEFKLLVNDVISKVTISSDKVKRRKDKNNKKRIEADQDGIHTETITLHHRIGKYYDYSIVLICRIVAYNTPIKWTNTISVFLYGYWIFYVDC